VFFVVVFSHLLPMKFHLDDAYSDDIETSKEGSSSRENVKKRKSLSKPTTC